MRVRRSPVQWLAAMSIVLLGVLVLAAGASAQDADGDDATGDTLSVRDVDGRDPDEVVVEFLYTGPRGAVTDLVLREAGTIVDHTPPVLLEQSQDFGIVLAIDTSASMEQNDAFQRAVDAASEFIRNKQPTDRIAVVRFSTGTEVVQGFTDDTETLLEAVGSLEADGGTAMYDALRQSVRLFEGTELVPNIVLLTDGEDSDSATTLDTAQSLLSDAGALLFTIGIESETLDRDVLQSLAESTGGEVRTSAQPAELGEVYAEVQASLRRQFRTTFVSEVERSGPIELTATIGTAQDRTAFQAGARLDPSFEVEAIPASEPEGVEFLQSDAFLWLALALSVVAVTGTVFAVGSAVIRERSALDTVLQPYDEGFVAPSDEDEGLVTSAFLQRAVDFTGEFAHRRGLLVRAERMLEQANLPLRAGEAIFFYLAFTALVVVLIAALTGNVLGTILGGAIVALVPPATVQFLASRRRAQFDEQLPDTLHLLSGTLRAGYSLMQGVEAAAQETAEPTRSELQRVVTESRLGMPITQAFQGVVRRMQSKDFDWAVMAIGIQREVGGNLAELLSTVADTMTQRERLRRDVKSLTAEGRMSAIVLGLLPIGLGAAMYVINPDYIGRLFDDTLGSVMVVGSGLLMGLGFFWMYKIIDIEV